MKSRVTSTFCRLITSAISFGYLLINNMSNFLQTIHPTPFGFFDADAAFQTEADAMVTFVKRKLGDDVLSVELTKKEIWACFEEACCEYSRLIHELKIQSELANVLGMPTGSGDDLTNIYPHQTFEFLMRQASPYASYAGIAGTYDATLAYFDIEPGRQDYNIYKELKEPVSGSSTGSLLYDNMSPKAPIRVLEVFHFEPWSGIGSAINSSNITNFLAANFNYESYVGGTMFYVLPVFEDVLRQSMLKTAFQVRRSNYSYEIIGSNLRIYPIPSSKSEGTKLFLKVFAGIQNPLSASALGDDDETIHGVSGPQNVPLGNIPYSSVTQPGRQWIRAYTVALAKEILGLIRSKISSIPIPNADLTLNGDALLSQAREDKDKLITQMKEFLANLTNAKLLEQQALQAENLNKVLKYTPMILGKAIIMG